MKFGLKVALGLFVGCVWALGGRVVEFVAGFCVLNGWLVYFMGLGSMGVLLAVNFTFCFLMLDSSILARGKAWDTVCGLNNLTKHLISSSKLVTKQLIVC